MKKQFQFLLCIALILGQASIFAQKKGFGQPRSIDSLKRELRNAKQDTSKLKLRMLLGEITPVSREGYWDSIISEAHDLKKPKLETEALQHFGNIILLHNEISRAIEYFNKSVKIAEENNYKWGVSEGYYRMAISYLNSASNVTNLNKAMESCYKGLRVAEEIHAQDQITAFRMALGRMYYFTGDTKKALEQHLIALDGFKKTTNNFDIINSLCDVGTDYQTLGDIPQSIHYYLETLKYVNELKGNAMEAETFKAVGAAYAMKNSYDSSDFYYNKAILVFRKVGSVSGVAGTIALLADNSLLRGDTRRAEEQALESLRLSKSVNFTIQIPILANLLKRIYLKDKNYKGALEAYELYVTTKDSVSNERNRKQALQKEFDYEFEKKANENKLLAQQNQIQSLELSQNKYFLWGMGVLLVLVFVIGYLFIRQNKIKTKQQSSQLEHKLLRSQMNPHFIFNSLQAIQNYVLKHDEKEAVRYLSSFAAVTRNVLENSRMEFIPLKKEIALLENYLQLQKLRFKNRFDYEIRVDETIDTENTNIPPMLAQPFIENAVEHGFHDITEEGKITVSYAVQNNTLLVEISDNGTGMKDGYAQNKQHHSLALEITKERVALMNKKAKNKVVFTIGEAFPFEKERKGVKVNFHLPLNLQS